MKELFLNRQGLMLRQSSASTRELTMQAREGYSKGRDKFMEGKPDMHPNSQPTNPENSEVKPVSAKEQVVEERVVLKELGDRQDLPVEVRRALKDLIGKDKIRDNSSTEKAKEVIKNASLGDAERIDSASQLLKRDLTEKQREALLAAHNLGKGEIGKDSNEAGVYNYTKAQLLRKARILEEAGFSKEERRVLMEAGLVGSIPETGIPTIDAELDIMDNLIDVGMSRQEAYIQAMANINRLTDVDAVEKQKIINQIKQKINPNKNIEKETREEMDRRIKGEMEHRFTFTFYPEEVKRLSEDPTAWLDEQFSKLYALAEEGQELNSPLIQDTQGKVSAAIDIVKKSNPENLSSFMSQFTVRLHLLQMRTAIGYKNIDQVKGAAGELRAHGLFLGMGLEKGRVGAMFNRFQDLLESTRLSGNTRHHVMLEDAYKLQVELISEQTKLAKRGVGGFGNLTGIMEGKVEDQESEDSSKWDDFTWATKTDKEIKKQIEEGILSEDRVKNIMKIKEIHASITRSVRTAYDVFVSSQRMAVVVARGKYLFDGPAYRSDPIGILNVYNMEALAFEKFDMYSPEQQEMLDIMKLDMADGYLKEQKEKWEKQEKEKKERKSFHEELKPPQELSKEQKLELGKNLFRDLFAVPDYFSSSWQIKGIADALEVRFGPTKAEDFALFMRLKTAETKKGKEEKGVKDKTLYREDLWKKIANYRPEEIIRLFRERKNEQLDSLYEQMGIVDKDLLTVTRTEKFKEYDKKMEKVIEDVRKDRAAKGETWLPIPDMVAAFGKDKLGKYQDEQGKYQDEYNDYRVLAEKEFGVDKEGKSHLQEYISLVKIKNDETKRGITEYDKFKEKYGAIISSLREEGFGAKDVDGEAAPTQLKLADLSSAQKEKVNMFLEEDKGKGADNLMDLAKKMQEFIAGKELIDALSTKAEFADIYARSIIVDDALLDKLEDEKPKKGSVKGYAPLSKLIGEAGAGGDTLTRVWNNTDFAIKAGNALIKFVKTEEFSEKMKESLEFATFAGNYNGLGPKGQAECLRYTMGTFLNISKLDMLWDIVGLNSLPFRQPASEAQRIFGPQASAIGRDELRGYLDHLHGYLSSSVAKAEEEMNERKRETLGKDYMEDNREKILNDLSIKDRKEANEIIKHDKVKGDEFLINKFKENLDIKYQGKIEESEKFYKDLEKLLAADTESAVKRFTLRYILYLLFIVIGEAYMIGKTGTEGFTKAS